MKKLFKMTALSLAVLSLSACGTSNDNANSVSNNSNDDAYNISVILKATDSDYWQTLLLGAEQASTDSNGAIKITSSGPTSEVDFEHQVSILENVIITEPDAIVIASGSVDATVPAIEDAMNKGIPVVTIDNKVDTDNITSFFATDHYIAAGLAAEEMVKKWEERGIDPQNKSVFVVSAVAGTMVNSQRVDGFIDVITELVPTINVIQTQYADNDISKATDIVLNTIMANDNLIGVFGDNNHMGIGIANAINETGKSESIVTYAFDSSPDEVIAVENGNLTGIVVQDPFKMGYDGVNYAVQAIEGNEVDKEVIVPTMIIDADNIDSPEAQKLLYP